MLKTALRPAAQLRQRKSVMSSLRRSAACATVYKPFSCSQKRLLHVSAPLRNTVTPATPEAQTVVNNNEKAKARRPPLFDTCLHGSLCVGDDGMRLQIAWSRI